MMYDVIIVGAGIAGLTAAIYAGRAGKSVLVLEGKVVGGQIIISYKVKNFPGFMEISGMELMENIRRQAEAAGAEIRFEKVVKIETEKVKDAVGKLATKDLSEKIVKTEENEYKARAVILAMGTTPRKLSAKQAADAGERPISYCATCDGDLYKNKPVVVVGSGNTAKHEIKYLEGIASKVHHIHHDDPIPQDAEAVFVAIGRVPDTEFLNGAVELDEDGYIVTNEVYRTSEEGIYAAGDCRVKDLRQLVTAAADGAAAATEVVKKLNNVI